jgi:glycosyltransferase involved in cell wall biosynthesis
VHIFEVFLYAGLSKPHTGSQQRYYNLVQQLQERGHDVVILEPDVCADPRDKTLAEVYLYHDVELFGRGLVEVRDIEPSYLREIFKIISTHNFDLIEISYPSGILIVKIATILTRKKAPIVYAPHNVESDIGQEAFWMAHLRTRIERYIVPRYLFALEKLTCRVLADSIITVSDKDRDILVGKFQVNREKVHVVTSGCTLTALTTDGERTAIREDLGIGRDALVIVFHGTYGYGPNREAFDVIEKELAPVVAASNEQAIFLLAGTGAPVFERRNVKSVGFVEDLGRLLTISDIAIVPLTSGGGTKLKVFEYMNASLPIIATKKAIEGIDMTDGQDALIAETVNDELIDKLLSLLGDEAERRRLGSNARRLLAAKYTWNAAGTQLVNTYADILGRRNAH